MTFFGHDGPSTFSKVQRIYLHVVISALLISRAILLLWIETGKTSVTLVYNAPGHGQRVRNLIFLEWAISNFALHLQEWFLEARSFAISLAWAVFLHHFQNSYSSIQVDPVTLQKCMGSHKGGLYGTETDTRATTSKILRCFSATVHNHRIRTRSKTRNTENRTQTRVRAFVADEQCQLVNSVRGRPNNVVTDAAIQKAVVTSYTRKSTLKTTKPIKI